MGIVADPVFKQASYFTAWKCQNEAYLPDNGPIAGLGLLDGRDGRMFFGITGRSDREIIPDGRAPYSCGWL